MHAGTTYKRLLPSARPLQGRGLGLVSLLAFSAVLFATGGARAQEVTVNGISLGGVHSALNITIDMIEFGQGDDPVVHLTAGRKHYQLALRSPAPIPMFDAELPLSSVPPRQFTIGVEDSREFRNCMVKGLTSSGSGSSYALSYAFACEDVSRPPLRCETCR